MAKWHIVQGEEGCRLAVREKSVAVIVDALRASATAAMLLDAGATYLLVVSEVDDAFAAKRAFPDALLFGERNGLPPEGFDGGNSPRAVGTARGRRVIFTTTTGAQRLVSAWGAAAVYMGTTINAAAVATVAARHRHDVVLIPAGLASDPAFSAQEDWAAAAAIATAANAEVETGRDEYAYWAARIASEGLPALFDSAPHAAKLRAIGLEEDTAYCARMNITTAVPRAVSRDALGVRVARA